MDTFWTGNCGSQGEVFMSGFRILPAMILIQAAVVISSCGELNPKGTVERVDRYVASWTAQENLCVEYRTKDPQLFAEQMSKQSIELSEVTVNPGEPWQQSACSKTGRLEKACVLSSKTDTFTVVQFHYGNQDMALLESDCVSLGGQFLKQ
jgi:hypothetical protein